MQTSPKRRRRLNAALDRIALLEAWQRRLVFAVIAVVVVNTAFQLVSQFWFDIQAFLSNPFRPDTFFSAQTPLYACYMGWIVMLLTVPLMQFALVRAGDVQRASSVLDMLATRPLLPGEMRSAVEHLDAVVLAAGLRMPEIRVTDAVGVNAAVIVAGRRRVIVFTTGVASLGEPGTEALCVLAVGCLVRHLSSPYARFRPSGVQRDSTNGYPPTAQFDEYDDRALALSRDPLRQARGLATIMRSSGALPKMPKEVRPFLLRRADGTEATRWREDLRVKRAYDYCRVSQLTHDERAWLGSVAAKEAVRREPLFGIE